ncbi:Allantoicase [Rhizina undulata]
MKLTITRTPESDFQRVFGASCIDLISRALGGEIVACSDEYFADAKNLIEPHAPIRKPGVFTEAGAWYDGWETRRHNREPADWVIVKLGVASGKVHGIEVDTAFFNGNQAPAISVEGCFLPDGTPSATATAWEMILPIQSCGPNQRHFWQLSPPTANAYTHVKLNMYPDGGIARFRLLGTAIPVFPKDLNTRIDLAHVSSGGLVVAFSDQHFGTKDNLLLPGRGVNMGDGWETARSREKGHVDWVIVKLGAPGYVDEIIVDTLHFRGNYPQKVELYTMSSPSHFVHSEATEWELAGASDCKADKEHSFVPGDGSLTVKAEKVVTHVKMVIIPDGGVKRLRVWGRRAA